MKKNIANKNKTNKRGNGPLFVLTYFTTTGTSAASNMPYEDSYAIALGFPCADATVTNCQVVKYNADGSVSKVAASTDKPFGVVVSSYRKEDNTVRVLTPFSAVMNGIADGTVADGDSVAASGIDAGGLTKFKTAASGDWIIGQCLSGSTTGLGIQVGVYRGGPSLKA